jgi:hypothetical protein
MLFSARASLAAAPLNFLVGFFQDCDDASIRAIAPGDNLDAADDTWGMNLRAASLQCGLFIRKARG